jgi:glycosyltransferase involved in cell wall biosynthesis
LNDGPVVIDQQFPTVPIIDGLFALIARWLGIPCVLTPHDVIPYECSPAVRRSLRFLYRRYDALIAHTQIAQRELEAILGHCSTSVHLIPLGHLNDSYDDGPRLQRLEACIRLGLAPESRVILFLGQIKREKGLEYLLHAFPAILQQYPDTLLLIAGRPWRADIAVYESLIDRLNLRDRVRLRWEYVPDRELALYYRAADVVALPYTRVYQSAVCLAAYAFCRPVVASAVGGLQEQVLDGETGFLVRPKDPQILAQALIAVLHDRTRAEAMGARGRAWAAEAFDWRRIAGQIAGLHLDVWRSRHKPFPRLAGKPRNAGVSDLRGL